jgi:hypothetical protein
VVDALVVRLIPSKNRFNVGCFELFRYLTAYRFRFRPSAPKPCFKVLDVIKKLRYLPQMIRLDPSLKPDWDEDNINHIAVHGIHPDQVEEVYYSEGPFPTFAIKNKKKRGGSTEYRYRLWGTDASGLCIEAIVAPYPKHGLWRCVTAFPMSDSTKKIYLKRVKK